jgi:hypothetical protein
MLHMIPEYKFYHGAVLAELVHRCAIPMQIDELHEVGRLSSYVLDSRVGVQIKHSRARLRPWHFTFTKLNISELQDLCHSFARVYVVLVCNTDGMVCLDIEEFLATLGSGESDQGWIRVDRPRGKWYEVSGGKTTVAKKLPRGIEPILQALGSQIREVYDEADTIE